MEYLQVLGLALLPAAGNFAGGVVAELVTPTRRQLSRALHVAAGIVVAIVAVELIPEATRGAAPPWAVVLGLALGGAFYMLLEWAIEAAVGARASGPWMVYAAVAIDLFSDGLIIGVSSVVSFGLALVLALGQVTADFPEGFATVANLKDKQVPRSRRMLVSALFVVPCLVGATIGYWLLRDQAESLKLVALAFTAGILVIAAGEEMIGEAHEGREDTSYTAGFFIAGFALFTLVALYLD